MSGISIRGAGPDDAGAIAAIYNQGIEDRVATLETQLRTADERAQWLAAKGPRHPVLVAVEPSLDAPIGACVERVELLRDERVVADVRLR